MKQGLARPCQYGQTKPHIVVNFITDSFCYFPIKNASSITSIDIWAKKVYDSGEKNQKNMKKVKNF